jgi:hypothetical protein
MFTSLPPSRPPSLPPSLPPWLQHHLYIGWALALWADFNAPLSAATLAVGAGIFVQGIGAYSFAPVFAGEGCFETPAAEALRCRFWAPGAFTVRVCPAQGAAPGHVCSAGAGGGWPP